MKTFILAKDVVAALTQTAILADVPQLDLDNPVVAAFTFSDAAVATATQDLTVDTYNPTDWADITKPATAHHIMINASTMEWKGNDAMAAGDMLIAVVNEQGSMLKVQ